MPKNYMTSLPNTADTQKGFVKTIDSPRVPAMDFRSGFKDVATAVENTNKFLDDFTKMKYEGFQADLDRLELEHLHEMVDAKDPCELEAINEKWNKAYDSALKDDIWSKSYYKSTFYDKWKNRNQEAQQKIYYQKQHEFAEIAATDTLNRMAETAAMLDNPVDIAQYLKNGEAMLANTQHLTAENKYKLMTNFYKDTVSRLYSSDPNKAVAWLDYVGDKYDGYGIDSNEIRTKAENYNRARQREIQADIARAEKQKVAEDKLNGLALAQRLAMGEISESEATLEASQMSPIAWNEYRKATPKKSSTTKTDYKPIHDVFLSEGDDKIGDWNDYKLSHPELTPAQITRGDNLSKIFETKDTTSKNPITVADEIKVGQVQSGELTMSDKDIEDNSHGNATLAKEFRNARTVYNKSVADKIKAEAAEKKTEEEKQLAKEEKKKEQQIKDKSNIALANINFASDENVADVFKKNLKDLTSADMKIASLRVKNARDKLAEKAEKEQGEKKKLLEAQIKALETAEKNARFNIMYDALSENPDAYTDEQINNADIEQTQKEKLKSAKEKSEKDFDASQKEFLADTRREINAGISSKWEKGQIITNIDDILTNYPYADNENRQNVYDWIVKGNKGVADSNWAEVKDKFFTFNQQNRVVSDEEIKDFINKIDNKATGKNYQEMFNDLSEIRNKIESSMSAEIKKSLNSFDTKWGNPLFDEATQLEKIQKMAAKDFYSNLLLNQKNLEGIQNVSTDKYIWELVAQYKPKESDIISYMEEKNILVSTLDNLQDKFFKEDKKTKKLIANDNVKYTDTVQLRGILNTALSKKLLTKAEYEKKMSAYSEVTAYALQKLEKQPNTILGATYYYLKSRLGENYNPAVMTQNLDEAINILNNLNINPYDSINKNFWDFILRTPDVVFDTNRLAVLAVGTILGAKLEENKVSARAENGQVIKLGDK